PQLGGCDGPHQATTERVVSLVFIAGEPPHLSAFERGNRNTVPEEDPVPVRGGNSLFVWRDEANEIERIRRGEHDLRASGSLLPDRPEQTHRLGQRELLPRHSRDEAATADLAARLQAPVDEDQFSPPRGTRLTTEKTAEDDAVPSQECQRLLLDRVVGRSRLEQGPPSSVRDGVGRGAAATLSGAAAEASPSTFRDEQSPQPGKRVRGRHAPRDELGERRLDLRREQSASSGQLVEEGSSTIAQHLVHGPRRGGESGRLRGGCDPRPERLAGEKPQRRGANR